MSKIAAIRDYYMVESPTVTVDTFWSMYESRLTDTLDSLISCERFSVTGQGWLRTLVPFVASAFIRGPDFAQRFEATPLIREVADNQTLDAPRLKSNTNMARMVALQRILTPIMAAEWVVFHAPKSTSFVISDTLIANFASAPHKLGWLIPLGLHEALGLLPLAEGEGRKILYDTGEGDWRAIIGHEYVHENDVAAINSTVAQSCSEFIAGAEQESVNLQEEALCDTRTPTRYDMLTTNRMQIVHEMEWYKLVCSLAHAPRNGFDFDADIDWEEVGRDWSPMPILATNLPAFTSGLKARGRSIELHLTEVPGFTDYSAGPFPWQSDDDTNKPL